MRRIVTIILMLTAMTGCFEADIHNTEHPDSAELQVAVDVPADGTYTIVIGGVEYEVVDGVASFSDYFAPGDYNAYVFNSVSGVSVECTENQAIASVAMSSGAIASDSGVLYFGSQGITVTADNVISTSMEMELVTADINLELTLEGGAFVDLKSSGGITVRLTGVAQQWDCVNRCCYGQSGYAEPTVKLQSTQIASTTRSDEVQSIVVQGSMTLLGLDSAQGQTIDVILSYTDGSTDTISADVSSQLSTLNSDKGTPINLSGEYETPLGADFSAGVIDWVVVDESGDIIDIY